MQLLKNPKIAYQFLGAGEGYTKYNIRYVNINFIDDLERLAAFERYVYITTRCAARSHLEAPHSQSNLEAPSVHQDFGGRLLPLLLGVA